MTLLHGLGVPELFSPELTAEWEFKLAQMEHGKLARDAFMREIVAMTKHIVGAGQELRERHDPRRLRDARRALPEVRRRSARELQEVPVPGLRLRLLEDHGRPPARARRGRGAAARARGRPARRLPQQARAGRSRRRSSSTTRIEVAVRLRRRGDDDDAEAPDFTARTPLGRVPQVRRARVRARPVPTSARRRSARTRPATSAPAA